MLGFIYTDHWEVYTCVLPSKRHFAVDKQTGLTNHIEAIWNFIHDYNRKIRQRLQRQQQAAFSPSFT